jgi:antitoxin VapB
VCVGASDVSQMAFSRSAQIVATARAEGVSSRQEGYIMMIVPPETERLARRVAAHSGKTPEEILRKAVETEALLIGLAPGEIGFPNKPVDLQRVREIARRVAAGPLLDTRPAKAILEDAWGRSE